MPSHYLNQCWNTVNWAPRNKLPCNFNRNSYILVPENSFENVIWKMAAICLDLNVLKRPHGRYSEFIPALYVFCHRCAWPPYSIRRLSLAGRRRTNECPMLQESCTTPPTDSWGKYGASRRPGGYESAQKGGSGYERGGRLIRPQTSRHRLYPLRRITDLMEVCDTT